VINYACLVSPGRLLVLFWVLVAVASPQQPRTRAEQIEEARREKAATLTPAKPEKGERIFSQYADPRVMDKLLGRFPGLRLKIGGLMTGSGFALGPEYFRPDLNNGNLTFRATLVGSLRRFYLMETHFAMPRLLKNRFALDLWMRRLDAPGIDYYGQGNKSFKSYRTNFRREETVFDGRAGWRPFRRHLLVGVTGGYAMYNVGPGKLAISPSTDALFSAPDTPGLAEQTNFWRGGPFAEYDRRDNAGDPHSGSRIQFYYSHVHDVDTHRYSFRRYTFEGEHYVPFFNQKRVIVVHAKTQFTVNDHLAQVPFYLQPTLGGSDDLRGYQRFRFYDNHMMVANAEYRWEVSRALDMAVFVDAGKVMSTRRQFNFAGLRSSAGLGFRVKTRDRVFMRVDAGASREGVQIWLKFSNAFSDSVY
jgi:hypothetical protein